MTMYQYRAVTRANRPASGTIEALDPVDASRRLLGQGLFPIDVSDGRRDLSALLAMPIGGRKVSRSQTTQMLADLGHLISAGVEIAASLSIIQTTTKHPRARALIEGLVEDVRKGHLLSDALHKSGSFPEHVVAIVRANEAGATLGPGLVRVAESLRRNTALQTQVRSALIYPITVLVAVFSAVLVLVLFVIPTLETVLEDGGRTLPWQTQVIVSFSRFIREHVVLLLSVVLIVTVSGIIFFRRGPGRIWIERIILTAPIIGSLLRAAETARIAGMLTTLTIARLPMVQVISLSRDGSLLATTRHQLSLAERRLREGARLHDALAHVETLEERLKALVRVGEITARLGSLLEEAARDADYRLKITIDRMMTLLTPAMTIVMGGIAGFVLYAVMTAILSVNDLSIGVP